MLTRIKKSAGTGGSGTWTEFTETKGSGTGQGRNVTFTIGLKVKSGYGNVKKPPNIAAKYDAIINYADSSVYQIPSANFWTTETTAQADFSFVNPYPSKTVTSITVKWYSYSSTATTCTLTYLGGTQPVISSITGNPIELTLTADQRAKQVRATYTPTQDLHGWSKPWAANGGGLAINLAENVDWYDESQYNTSGSLVYNAKRAATGKMAVTGSKVYANWEYSPYTVRGILCAWDENDNLLDRTSSGFTSGTVITLPAGTTQIALTFYNAADHNVNDEAPFGYVMVGEGDTNIPYRNVCPIGITVDLFATAGKNMTGIASYKSAAGVTWTVNADGTISTTGQATANTYLDVPVPSFLIGDYTYCGSPPNGSNSTYYLYGRDQTLAARTKKWDGTTSSGYSYGTVPQQVKFIKGHNNVLRLYVASGVNTDGLVWTPMILKKGDNDTTYTAPQNDEHTVNFAETIYGGTYYAGGAFDEEYINIASYNGEAINEPWLSSLDEYTPGGTPTTGAQVVYPANQVVKTVAADSLPLDLHQGTNNIFANEADDISLSYEE